MTVNVEYAIAQAPNPQAEKPTSLYVVSDDLNTGDRVVSFHPHDGQLRALYSQARITAFISGSQGGKSVLGPFWLYTRMRGFSVPELGIEIPAMGEGTYLAVSATYDLTNLKLIPELIKFFEHTMGIGRWFAGDRIMELKEPPKNDDGTYDYDNWSDGKYLATTSSSPMWAQIIVRSAESKGGLESSTARAAWLDEAGMPSFGRDAWEAILRRLSISRGPILITTTPYFPGGWMKSDVFDPADRQDPTVRLVRIPSYVNPAFSMEEFEDRRAKMNPARFRMMYMGIPTQLSGLIYPDFDYVSMTVPRGKRLLMNAATWTFVGGIDFGWHADFAMVLMGLSPSGAVYMLRSRKKPETLLDDHMLVMRDWMDGLPAGASVKWIADPSGKLEIETLKSRGFWVEAGMNTPAAIIAGIDSFTALIRTGRFWLYGSHSQFLDEISNYVWQEGQDEQPLDKPYKGNDHLCLAGGTMVLMADGSEKKISDVRVGDMVQTDVGPCAVSFSGQTGARECLEVEFSDGGRLRGTPEHPVVLSDGREVRLGALRYGDIITTWKTRTDEQSVVRGAGASTPGILIRQSRQIATFVLRLVRGICIGMYGKMRTALSQMAGMFTTLTGTLGTMYSKISAPCRSSIISASIGRQNALPPLPRGPHSFARSPFLGISRMTGASGTEGMPRAAGSAWWGEWKNYANSAARGILTKPLAVMVDSVQTTASLFGAARRGSTTKSEHAPNAAPCSRSTSITRPNDVVVSVVRLREVGIVEPVYDLTVEGRHRFYANGYLVLNCDAVRYCVSGIASYTPLAIGTPMLQRPQTNIRERALAAVNRRGATSTEALRARLLGR